MQHNRYPENIFQWEHNSYIVKCWCQIFCLWQQVALSRRHEAPGKGRRRSNIFNYWCSWSTAWSYPSTAFFKEKQSFNCYSHFKWVYHWWNWISYNGLHMFDSCNVVSVPDLKIMFVAKHHYSIWYQSCFALLNMNREFIWILGKIILCGFSILWFYMNRFHLHWWINLLKLS